MKSSIIMNAVAKYVIQVITTPFMLLMIGAVKVIPARTTKVTSLAISNTDEISTPTDLSADLISLKIENYSGLTLPLSLPAALTELSIHSCSTLTSTPALPAGLRALNICYCPGFTSFSALPASLTSLVINRCERLAFFPVLPAGLTNLSINACKEVTSLPNLPTRLITLRINECERLTSLPALPSGLKMLNIDNFWGLTALSALPASLTALNMQSCYKLTELPALPSSLTALDMRDCFDIKAFPILPADLTFLDISGCERFEALPESWPNALITLKMGYCARVAALPDWPTSLKSLDISGCERIETLPDAWPDALITLNTGYCSRLAALPALPAGLKNLDINGCERLISIPALPAGLINLDISYCHRLTNLPFLPSSLIFLNLEECSSLRLTAELSAQLQRLEASGCDIRYPEHFTVDNQSQLLQHRLADAIQASSLQPKPVHIQKLLHRFLSESLGQRGVVHELCAMVEPIIAFLESSPQHLASAENIASGFLDGCVNQPVRGWSEIASWMYVAQAPDFESQLEAVRYPLALRSIEELIAKESPGSHVEVEGANALLSQSYAQLQSTMDITRPWPCIPQGIAYEGMITSWLTEDKVSSIVKKVQGLSLEDLAQSVSNTAYSSLWGDIAFPEHIKAIHHKYEQLMENYESLIRLRAGASIDIVLRELDSDERRGDFKSFHVDMDSVEISQLKEHCKTLPNKREEEVATTVAILTKEGFEKICPEKSVAHSNPIAFYQPPIKSYAPPPVSKVLHHRPSS